MTCKKEALECYSEKGNHEIETTSVLINLSIPGRFFGIARLPIHHDCLSSTHRNNTVFISCLKWWRMQRITSNIRIHAPLRLLTQIPYHENTTEYLGLQEIIYILLYLLKQLQFFCFSLNCVSCNIKVRRIKCQKYCI